MDQYGASSSSSSSDQPGRIRKRRYSTARIQPTRIKKVMQSDEDIGRMIASVPVAIGSVMEHFAEKLLENAKDVMEKSASKTLSPAHIIGAINRTKYLHDFLEPVVSNFGGISTTSSSSPVTPPTNGLMSRPFENFSSSQISSPMEDNKFDLNALMRDTAKSHLASNIAAASSVSSTLSSSSIDEGKRRRGRPKKLDEKEKPKASSITILSSSNGKQFPCSTISSNGVSLSADLDRDKLLMPPPLLVPQRNIKVQQPQKVIIPKTMISNNNTTSTQSSSSTTTTMVVSSSNSTDQQSSDAISA
jgi:hypothetical protein